MKMKNKNVRIKKWLKKGYWEWGFRFSLGFIGSFFYVYQIWDLEGWKKMVFNEYRKF